jgi:hypothetical protein
VAADGVSHICSLFDDGVASNANLRTSPARKKKIIENLKEIFHLNNLLVY